MSISYPLGKNTKAGSVHVYDPTLDVNLKTKRPELNKGVINEENLLVALENVAKTTPDQSDSVGTKIRVNSAGIVVSVSGQTKEDIPAHKHNSVNINLTANTSIYTLPVNITDKTTIWQILINGVEVPESQYTINNTTNTLTFNFQPDQACVAVIRY